VDIEDDIMVSTNDVLGNRGTTGSFDHAVFLNFGSRESGTDTTASITNRIMLKCESVGINTNRSIPSFPVPFSGLIRGESTTLAIDLGIATKTIQLNGVITDQMISKQVGTDDPINVSMTASEVAQLLHSSVDSSFLQQHQNLNELIILYPSRVSNAYTYHAGVDETTNHELLPLIPFTWSSRTIDRASTITVGNVTFPDPTATEITGISGFISQLGTEFAAGQIITFNLSFTEAVIAGGEMINSLIS